MRVPPDAFRHCPNCGAASDGAAAAPFECGACAFVFFFNPAVAAAALVLAPDGRALFIRRAEDPARGRLALVGGFVEAGESLEQALRREVREEVHVDLTAIDYLSSHPNAYAYRGLTYPVVDVFFVGRADRIESATAGEGVESVAWLDPDAVNPAELAFPSMRAALAVFQQRRATAAGGGA